MAILPADTPFSLTREQTKKLVGVGERQLDRLMAAALVPKLKVGTQGVRYLRDDIEGYMQASRNGHLTAFIEQRKAEQKLRTDKGSVAPIPTRPRKPKAAAEAQDDVAFVSDSYRIEAEANDPLPEGFGFALEAVLVTLGFAGIFVCQYRGNKFSLAWSKSLPFDPAAVMSAISRSLESDGMIAAILPDPGLH
jgi:hypothetical protein